MPSSQPGYQGSEFLQFSHETEVPSLHLQSGMESVLFCGFHPLLGPPSILKDSIEV